MSNGTFAIRVPCAKFQVLSHSSMNSLGKTSKSPHSFGGGPLSDIERRKSMSGLRGWARSEGVLISNG